MIWEILRELKKRIHQSDPSYEFISIRLNDDGLDIKFDEVLKPCSMIIDFKGKTYLDGAHFLTTSPLSLQTLRNDCFTEDDIRLLALYLPYVILPYYSKQLKKCFAITHFAQSIDGRIASLTGDSKWVGNKENLIHAHKMRALCDAILVGSKTLEKDNPKLTVRHIAGDNPTRVIIGGDNLSLEKYFAVDDRTIIFSQNHNGVKQYGHKIKLNKYSNLYDTKEILASLFELGIHSVYIEGGSYTTSCFLKQKTIDQVQAHISPKIIGSGITGFNFSGVDQLEDAIEFESYRFVPMGDHMMFIGDL